MPQIFVFSFRESVIQFPFGFQFLVRAQEAVGYNEALNLQIEIQRIDQVFRYAFPYVALT